MDSLDHIWDEPAETIIPRSSSASRQSEPLFLNSDDDEPPTKKLQVDVDIDAMFDDVENEDDPFNFKPLTSNLDAEALRQEAEARHRKNLLSLTPHAIMSSSPPREMGDNERSKPSATGGDKGKDGKRERRKPVKLDEGRLLGPSGFPKLIKDTKNFKIKGKGHEETDLNRLLQVYGYWTHEMYPKTTFHDTVERIEKLCHSKRMNVSLSVWRDEAHGLINGRKPDEDDEVIDLTEAPETDRNTLRKSSSRGSSPVSDDAAAASSSSRLPSRPPSSGTEIDDEDDFDIDAVIREEEVRLAGKGAVSQPPISNSGNKGKSKAQVDDDDDALMWEALDAMQSGSSLSVKAALQVSKTKDDDFMWDELDALQASAPDAQVSVKPSAHIPDDEDMWDVIQEMEDEAMAKGKLLQPTALAAPATFISTTVHNDDDDWESMYA
ncbi:hypothetical protein H0H81_011107 [Sphagnurus paluster]|uniref:Chromosome segregation in meiosis protein n=1 Tax=Sphagnurus paluster TaxID=117069 RepID=A0A9P7GIP8_9AGAR|nr:hypothetical protein H0H81_011107 [Sphagnurus paluster]